MQALWSDLRYGARMLLKNPGFSLAAILTLALGIGGNTAVFTVINALLLKAFPYGDPQQLVLLNTQRRGNNDPGGFTLNRYDLVRGRDRSFSGLAVFTNDSFNLTGHGEPQQVPVARVSPDFFTVLGVILPFALVGFLIWLPYRLLVQRRQINWNGLPRQAGQTLRTIVTLPLRIAAAPPPNSL